MPPGAANAFYTLLAMYFTPNWGPAVPPVCCDQTSPYRSIVIEAIFVCSILLNTWVNLVLMGSKAFLVLALRLRLLNLQAQRLSKMTLDHNAMRSFYADR